MTHKIASTFTSFIFDQGRKVFTPDDLGNFDLRPIQENGIIDESCRRVVNGQPGARLNGQAFEIGPDPLAFYVEIIHDRGTFDMVYQGTSVFVDGDQVTSIAGIRKKVAHPGLAPFDLAAQDETTWVVTKP